MNQQEIDQIPPPQEIKLDRQGTSLRLETSEKRVGYQTYFCLLGTVLMVLSILSYYMYSDALDHYEYIIENWQQLPISQVRLSFDQCFINEINLVNYVWPGTKDGCDCRYKSRILSEQIKNHHTWVPRNKIYNNHACNITQLAWGCVSIYELGPIEFNKFPSMQNEGFLLCAILEKDNSFYSHLPESSECNEGYIKCGTQDDYFYCTKEKECPIFQIGFKYTTQIQNSSEQTEHNLTLLYSRNSANTLPIVDFRITEGLGVCMKNHIRGITPGREDYTLMRVNKTDCEIDRRFTKLISSDEVSFYTVNNQMRLQQRLRGYEINKAYQWGFYARSYIPWKMSCRGELFDEFIDQQSILEKILIGQRSLMIVSIIFFAIISVGLTFVQYQTLSGEDWPCIKGKGIEESNKIFYFEICCKVILQSIDAFIIILTFNQARKEVVFLETVINNQCSDEYVQNQLIYLKDQLDENIYRFNLAQLILFIITTILDISVALYLMWQFIKYKKNKENNIEQQNLNYEMQNQSQQNQNNPFQF